MALKVLGQVAPSASTLTTLYTVPASKAAVVSSLTVANRGTTSATFRVAVRPDGAGIADQHYIFFGVLLSSGDAFAATLGLTLAATDVVSVWASTANLSFNAFGEEVNA